MLDRASPFSPNDIRLYIHEDWIWKGKLQRPTSQASCSMLSSSIRSKAPVPVGASWPMMMFSDRPFMSSSSENMAALHTPAAELKVHRFSCSMSAMCTATPQTLLTAP